MSLCALILCASAKSVYAEPDHQRGKWFAPPTYHSVQAGTTQLESLINSPQLWANALKYVTVFKIYIYYLNEYPDAVLRDLFQFLKAHNIKLALETPPLTMIDKDHCGWAIEGYTLASKLTFYAEKIRSLGGDLAYVGMDEPLFYGHDFTAPAGKTACHAPIEAVAADAAANLNRISAVFPKVEVGDIEPLGLLSDGNLEIELTTWLTAFQKASGRPLAFFHVDVMFDDTIDEAQKIAHRVMTKAKIPFGFIYNGSPAATSNRAWMASATARAKKLNSFAFADTDQILQDWNMFPTAYLPESSDTALTYLVNHVDSRAAHNEPLAAFYFVRSPANALMRDVTTSVGEARAYKANGWTSVGLYIFKDPEAEPGLVAITKLVRRNSGGANTPPDVLISNSESEIETAMKNGFGQKQLLGYGYSASDLAGKPLWRAYNPKANLRIYTIYENEYNNLPASDWKHEGIVARLPYY